MLARSLVVVAMLVACLFGAASAALASEQFGDLDVAFLSLKVNARGETVAMGLIVDVGARQRGAHEHHEEAGGDERSPARKGA